MNLNGKIAVPPVLSQCIATEVGQKRMVFRGNWRVWIDVKIGQRKDHCYIYIYINQFFDHLYLVSLHTFFPFLLLQS